jgi:hypothetical protein
MKCLHNLSCHSGYTPPCQGSSAEYLSARPVTLFFLSSPAHACAAPPPKTLGNCLLGSPRPLATACLAHQDPWQLPAWLTSTATSTRGAHAATTPMCKPRHPSLPSHTTHACPPPRTPHTCRGAVALLLAHHAPFIHGPAGGMRRSTTACLWFLVNGWYKFVCPSVHLTATDKL